jgi:hypothetical protein
MVVFSKYRPPVWSWSWSWESVAVGLKRLLPPGSCVNDVGPEEGRSSNNQSHFNHAELITESCRKAAVSSTKSSPTQIYP